MNDLIVTEKLAEWQRLKGLVLDSVSWQITRRVYKMAPDEFMVWFRLAPRLAFTKATVSAWRVSVEAAASVRPRSVPGCQPFANSRSRHPTMGSSHQKLAVTAPLA
jgi:hypothetical protein